jgi:hypothetical protein
VTGKVSRVLAYLTMPSIAIVGIVGCAILYNNHPAEVSWIPKCPFYDLTGYKCPGCGTLRGIHHLLHLRFSAAWDMNPLMIVLTPLIAALLVWPRLSRNLAVGVSVTVVIVLYWLLRNIAGW